MAHLLDDAVAQVWTGMCGRPVRSAGDDLATTFRGCQRDGIVGRPEALARLKGLLGRAPRNYHAVARQALENWRA